MAGPAPTLSQMLPTRPSPMDAATAQSGGRHHYGAMARNQMTTPLQGGVPSGDELADQVVGEMFGGLGVPETDESLFAEADALIYAIEHDLD